MISDCAGPNGMPNSVLMSGPVPTTGAGPALATPSLALICDAAAAASCAALVAPLSIHITYITLHNITHHAILYNHYADIHNFTVKVK